MNNLNIFIYFMIKKLHRLVNIILYKKDDNNYI